MKKDNFDIKAFLVENKLTENSRGNRGRYHFNGEEKNTGAIRILSEMQIPADPDSAELENYDDDLEECGPELGVGLEEAGYTDVDDSPEFGDSADDLSLMNLLSKDKKAGAARKAAEKAMDAEIDPTDGEPEFPDTPAVDPEDAEDGEGGGEDLAPEEPAAEPAEPAAPAQGGQLVNSLRYNKATTEMEMDDAELEQYLSGFRRPQVAANYLSRALRAAQREVNESIGLNSLYLVLRNGFYETSRSPRDRVIAKVNADQAWRDKNFRDD